MTSPETAVTTAAAPESKALVTASTMDALVALSGVGFEGATAADYALPFLRVLQKMSPEVDEADEKHVPGAKPGMLMDSVTQELFDGTAGISVIAVSFQKSYNLWVPRNAGGGYKGYGNTQQEAAEMVKQLEKNGFDKPLDIVDTANHYLLAELPNGERRAFVLSCTSTKLKASRTWMSVMARVVVNKVPMPSFSKTYLLQTVPQKNDKGTFFNFKATPNEGWVNEEQLDAAKAFHSQVKSGLKGADFSQAEEIEAEITAIEVDPTAPTY